MKHLALTIALLITFASQAVAGETVMVCDAKDYEKKYYKIVKPLLGASSVKEKVDGKWVDWCAKMKPSDVKTCNIEIYDSAAKRTEFASKAMVKSDMSVGLGFGDILSGTGVTLIDFEFGKKSVLIKYYVDKTGKEIMSWREDKEYSCEIQ